MSNQNNDHSGIAIIVAFFGMAAIIMFAAIFALAAFAAVGLTILALCAWHRPVTLFGETMHPDEARAFVYRGLIGMAVLPLFVIFCAALFKFQIEDQAWVYLFLGGYTAGSIGVEVLKAQAEAEAAANATIIPPAPPAALPQPEPPRPAGKPDERFTFADWNDEEPRR